jgi:hypothetical protein
MPAAHLHGSDASLSMPLDPAHCQGGRIEIDLISEKINKLAGP